MKKSIYTVVAVVCCMFIGLLVLTSCNEDEGYSSTTPQTPAFVWEDASILLDIDNGWGFTRYKNRVAITNMEKKSQYLLTWDGDMTDGTKPDATLRVAKNGEITQVLALDELSIEEIDGSYCRISFGQGTKTGTLIFSKLPEY